MKVEKLIASIEVKMSPAQYESYTLYMQVQGTLDEDDDIDVCADELFALCAEALTRKMAPVAQVNAAAKERWDRLLAAAPRKLEIKQAEEDEQAALKDKLKTLNPNEERAE